MWSRRFDRPGRQYRWGIQRHIYHSDLSSSPPGYPCPDEEKGEHHHHRRQNNDNSGLLVIGQDLQ
jgi:hypothetical protein